MFQTFGCGNINKVRELIVILETEISNKVLN